ncbi:MAG: iron-containing alcohol dehydrogenase family protein [Patescibacteria group bacterium]
MNTPQFRSIKVPLFIKIDQDLQIYRILDEYNINFDNSLIVTTKNTKNRLEDKLFENLENNFYFVSENSIDEGDKLIADINKNKYDLLICIGGGRVLDIGKYSASKTKLNFVSVPTTPSNDGIASPIAVLKNKEGQTESLGVNMPLGIIVDLEILKSAPVENIKAGTGDLLSNFSALKDWKLSGEKIDDFAASLAYSAADLMYGKFAQNMKVELNSENFLKTLVNGLILSGIAMNIAGTSRPCSGAEHEISHAIDELFPGRSMHGLQVALGVLIAQKMRGDNFENYKNFFKSIGLPTKPEDIDLTTDELVKAIDYAPQTRPDRITILEKQKLNKKQISELIKTL